MSGTAKHRGWGWIRKRDSGRYQASYIGPDNRRHFAPTTFSRKSDAEAWLGRERRDIEDAVGSIGLGQKLVWVSPSERMLAAVDFNRETVAEYSARWIQQRNVKPRTTIHYQSILDRHIIPVLGKITLANLKSVAVRDWYSQLLVDKPTMRSHAYQLLHAICATAVADEILDRNPCQIDGATATKRSRELVVPEIGELSVIADKIESKYRALVLIPAWCGLRFGETIELRRKDFEYGKDSDHPHSVHIARAVTHRNDGETRCRVDTPKSGKGRTVVIPPHIRADISAHLDEFVESSADALLFVPARGGCHVSDRVVRAAFVPACSSAGLENVRLHDLRHFAGHQTARVANLPETMQRLGHSTQGASLRYQGVVSGRAEKIAQDLSNLVVPQ